MSAVKIRAALETALNAMASPISTSWENQAFVPPIATTPYQIANVLLAQPSNLVYGSEHQELGFMQVKLMYPLQIGTATVAARAESLRSTFSRGSSFTASGVTVIISKTPEIMAGRIEESRYAVVVKIPFYSNIN
jgi:hypothetical protein